MRIPLGLCQCGCGERTWVPPHNKRGRGIAAGVPRPFVAGHHMRPKKPRYTVDGKTGCWIWQWNKCKGYGYAWDPKRRTMNYVHIMLYESVFGPVPRDRELDHKCRRTDCVNPAHLEPVTHAENIRRGRNAKLTSDEARQIRELRKAGVALRAIARRFGVSIPAVCHVMSGRCWRVR